MMEVLLTIVAALFIAWELAGIVFSHGKVQITGAIYGRRASMGIMAALYAVYIFLNRETLLLYWFAYVAIGIALALYFCLKSGLGEQGLYINGRFIPYTNVKSYSLDQTEADKFCLRLEGKYKDYMLEIPTRKKGEVEARIKQIKLPLSKVNRR